MHAETDVLVIGSGIAGISFALKAAEKFKVTVVTKAEVFLSNTVYAQGGIACAWSVNDDPEQHIHDTLIAGAGLCNKNAVKLLAYNAAAAMHDLLAFKVPFSKKLSGEIHLGREGGHSQSRILHVQDFTGKAVQEVLLKKAQEHPNISLFTHHFATDLLVRNHICHGAKILDLKHHKLKIINAQYTALCTGGAGQVYAETTNPAIATGDGIAMAYRAGAEIKDLEFVQFHPTALFHEKADGFLISEALRGAGAKLTDNSGKPFMHKYHPLADLAPRDIVARAIVTEMHKSSSHCVYLDATHIPIHELILEFPQIYNKCSELGIDISREKIPVVPSAHYMCGGVKTDLHAQTNINRLYAFGEVACTGVHGANRLASNSLLEGMVFAKQAFDHIVKNHGSNFLYFDRKEHHRPTYSCINMETELIRQQIKHIMSANFGIVRNRKSMLMAYMHLNKLYRDIQTIKAEAELNFYVLETENVALTALLIAKAAIKRKRSVGAHFIQPESNSKTAYIRSRKNALA